MLTRPVRSFISRSRRRNREGIAESVRALCAWLAILVPGLLPNLLYGQVVQLPVETPLSIELLQHVPMKTGKSLQGRLLYPAYVDNHLVLPAGTALRGRVMQLEPDRSHRIHSRLRGDFTPFHTPVVQFDQLVLPDGTLESVETGSTKDGVPVLRLSPPPGKRKGSFLARQWDAQKERLKEMGAVFTAPGRGDRLVQLLYTQLPWHPERIEAGTAWTVTLDQPLSVQAINTPPKAVPAAVATSPDPASDQTSDQASEKVKEWRLRAYLQQTISSAKQKPGDRFDALVAEPVYDADHTVAVPQGTILVGEITQTKPARSFGRNGKLRFRFRELTFPSGFVQPVQGTVAGIDANKASNLEIDSEGGVQQKPQNRVIVPLVLTLLAGRALDEDGSEIAHSAVGSNGFGIVGRLIGILSSRNVAAGIGAYGAALSIYELWLTHGHDVVFTKNTRVEVNTTPSRSPMTASVSREKPSVP